MRMKLSATPVSPFMIVMTPSAQCTPRRRGRRVRRRAPPRRQRVAATSWTGRVARRDAASGERLAYPLRGVVEELFLGDALALPALVRELFHLGERAVGPLEAEPPVHDDEVATDQRRSQAS